MKFEEFNIKIQEDKGYKFLKEHEKVFRILEGFLIIGLLVGILLFMIQDQDIKKQIADHCGYETSEYRCICEADLVTNWEELRDMNLTINLSDYTNAKVDFGNS